MLAKEFIYNIRTVFDSEGRSLNSYTDQHLMYMLDTSRAILAKRRIDKNENVEEMIQFLDASVTPAELTEMGTIGNTRVMKVKIPQPVTYTNSYAIFNMGSTDGAESFTKISYSQLRTVFFRKHTSETPKFFMLEDNLFLVNTDMDSKAVVRVRGIFSEPYKVIQEKGDYKFLDPFNWRYPLSLKDADTVYKLALSGELGWGDIASSAVAEAVREREQQQQRNA